ncbi:MAG: hypothetical protein DI529_02595 [Chryseobacterium sp.]|nr:MAG: hypothetical protein DI529_02595 [Chryseobacterium sp.]
MKKILLPVAIFIFAFTFGQEKKNYKEGIITTSTNEIIAFKDLTWDKNGKAHYLNATNKEMEELFDNSIKNIEEVSESDPKFTSITGETFQPSSSNAGKENTAKTDYPEGIYTTKEDFIKKTPSKNQKLSKKGLIGFTKELVDDSVSECFFYDFNSDKKLKDVFAVVYHGSLYFNIAAILTNRNKTDRAQTSDFPNSFVKVLFGGDNYLYTEAALANVWAKGLAYNAGAAGGVLAGTLNTGKGIVWDYKNQEFNIFKNCEDYNDFIKDKYPNGVQKCPKQQPDNIEVRKAIDIIK